MEHHRLPLTLSSLVTGLETVPIERQCDEHVFQEDAER